MMIWKRTLAAIAGSAVLMLGGAHPAAAQSTPAKFTIRPAEGNSPFFTIDAGPGESRQVSVALANGSDAPAPARTYAADAYTTVNGGLGARLWGDPKTGTTTWVSYPDEVLEIAPKIEVHRSVTIEVPKDASPGEHLTSLVIENAELAGGAGAVQTQQRLRQVIAVLVRVPGPRTPGLELGAGHHNIVGKLSVVAVSLKNTGNVLLKPAGNIVIKDGKGDEVSATTVKFGSLYAGDTADLEVPLASALQPGSYSAALSLADDATGASAQGDVAFSVTVEETARAASAPTPELPAVRQTTSTTVANGGGGGSSVSVGLFVGGLAGTAILVGGVVWLVGRRRRSG
jgi:hypothetical protein